MYKQSMCLNFYTTTMKILPLYLFPTRKRIKKIKFILTAKINATTCSAMVKVSRMVFSF